MGESCLSLRVIYMKDKLSFGILIPAFNEEKTVGVLLDRLAVLCRKGIHPDICSVQIVIVNDGSTDGTQSVIEDFVRTNPDLDIRTVMQENGGKGSAIRRALQETDADILVMQDADLECDPENLALMLPHITSGEYSVVYGSRYLHKKCGFNLFHLGCTLITSISNILFGLHLTDALTCYKMFTKEVAQTVRLESTGFELCTEFLAKVAKAGYAIKEVPIHYHPRTVAEGKKIRLRDGIRLLFTLIRNRVVS